VASATVYPTFVLTYQADRKRQVAVLHDLFGPLPFRAVAADPALLRNDALVRRAQAAYDGRVMPQGVLDPARLAALADELDKLGPAADELVRHLRVPAAVHYRGCWALDVLLGRTGEGS
jgi:hypothetical protein